MSASDRTKPTATTAAWDTKPGLRVWVGGHNLHARREIEKHLAGTIRPPTGPIDAAFIAPQSIDEAAYFGCKLRARLARDGVVWVVCASPAQPQETGRDTAKAGVSAAMSRCGLVDAGSVDVTNELALMRFRRSAPEGEGGRPS